MFFVKLNTVRICKNSVALSRGNTSLSKHPVPCDDSVRDVIMNIVFHSLWRNK